MAGFQTLSKIEYENCGLYDIHPCHNTNLFLICFFCLKYLTLFDPRGEEIGYYSLIALPLALTLNIKNENFGQNLNVKFLPQPPSEGGTKKTIFLKIGRRA